MSSKSSRTLIVGLHYAPERSGNAPYTSGLARGLVGLQKSVRVLTGFPHYPEWKRSAGYTGWRMNQVLDGVELRRLNHFVPSTPRIHSRLLMELSFGLQVSFARWGSPDVVVLVSPALFSTALALVRARLLREKAPIVVWVQDLYSLGVKETRTSGLFGARAMKWVESSVLKSADGVVVIHERFREYVTTQLGVEAERVQVIRNWTHLKQFTLEDKSATRTSFGWTENEVVVLHTGNMGTKQGLENVIDAARLADHQNANIRFILIGDGNQRAHLEELGRDVKRIEFMNSLPGARFQEALAAADILLVNELPGVKEMSVPSKLTSYFSAGVPVLAATDEGSVTAEEIASSAAGLRVDAGNPVALVEGALALSADRDQGRAYSRNGTSFMNTALSEDYAIDTYDRYLMHLAAGSQPDVRHNHSGEDNA